MHSSTCLYSTYNVRIYPYMAKPNHSWYVYIQLTIHIMCFQQISHVKFPQIYILLSLQHQCYSTRLNTIYAVISAGWIFRKLPVGRVFCNFNFTNGSLVIYISIIQKYIREDIYFREGQLPHKECIRYISRTQLQLTLSTLLNWSACWLLHVLAYKKALHPFCKRESAITTQPSCSKENNTADTPNLKTT